MKSLLTEISHCKLCETYLPLGARPIVQASSQSKVLLIGQAPGLKVHTTGVPWDDPSGDQLRKWLGVNKTEFYAADLFALMPMGFCYPGKGKSGDLPPRPECAPQWHQRLLNKMPEIKLTLLIGQYAQKHYLQNAYPTLTENVRHHAQFWPTYLPLPHPSPRNRFWQNNNPWFVAEVLPILKARIAAIRAA